MTARKTVHKDIYDTPGTPPTFLASVTVCAPRGSTTPAGWDRMYLSTTDPALVTCSRCLKRMEAP